MCFWHVIMLVNYGYIMKEAKGGFSDLQYSRAKTYVDATSTAYAVHWSSRDISRDSAPPMCGLSNFCINCTTYGGIVPLSLPSSHILLSLSGTRALEHRADQFYMFCAWPAENWGTRDLSNRLSNLSLHSLDITIQKIGVVENWWVSSHVAHDDHRYFLPSSCAHSHSYLFLRLHPLFWHPLRL